MTIQDDYFSDVKEWSKRKLNIVQKYLDGFSKILGSTIQGAVYYIDGFAGRGVYDSGEIGSPVLAAKLADEIQFKEQSYHLLCINVEENSDNFDNLQYETTRFGNLVNNYSGALSENIGTILDEIGNAPAIFFLDDFGVKGTDWSIVESVIERKYPTDLWIRFDHKTVRRLSGFATSNSKEAEGKLALLPKLFGINDSDYLIQRLDGPTPEKRIQNAVLLYLERLKYTFQEFGKNGFAAAYPIISLDGQRKYHLVFACSHPTAATLASNIVYGEEENFQKELQEYNESSTLQPSLFPLDPTPDEIFANKVRSLKDEIICLVPDQPLSRVELHYELLCKNKGLFGKIGRRHLTQALKEMLAEKCPKITCEGTPGNDKCVITIHQAEQLC